MAKRVLVIDDEEAVRHLLQQVLAIAGHDVSTAATAEEGLAEHARQPFDLIVADNNLPGQLAGLDIIIRVPGIPVIIITGYGSIEVPMRAHELGAAGYLLKPFDDISRVPKEGERVFARLERVRELDARLRGKKHDHA